MPKKIHCGKRHFLLLIETGITDFFYYLYIDCSYLKGTLGEKKTGGHRAYFKAMSQNRPF